jgi:hypothetical protein
MKLPKEFLDDIVKETEDSFNGYERKPYLSLEDLINETSKLYNNEKEVVFLDNIYDIKNTIKNSENPWVYHYTLNLNWVVFFNKLYQKMWINSLEDNDFDDVYLKTCVLEIIFNHVDGIIEDEDKVFLIKDDVNLIQKGIKKFTLS